MNNFFSLVYLEFSRYLFICTCILVEIIKTRLVDWLEINKRISFITYSKYDFPKDD